MNIVVPAIKLIQNEHEILLFSIEASTLIEISYFNPREIDRETGIQRQFQADRSKQIAEYLDTDEAVLPNDIIINLELARLKLKLDDVYDNKSKSLNIGLIIEAAGAKANIEKKQLRNKIAFVIDGQHRLRAFEYLANKSFSLIVAAMIDLSLAEVAEIFVKINYYQKPVNKSLVFDLLGISKEIFPKYFNNHNVVTKLNEDIASPFYGKVKMLGTGKGFISQAGIITAIEKYKIEETVKKYFQKSDDILYDAIWNYFSAVQNTFSNYWVEGNRIAKTIGIRALFLVMAYLLDKFSRESIAFSEKNISKCLNKIDLNRTLNETEGIGGEKGVKVLAEKMKDQMEA